MNKTSLLAIALLGTTSTLRADEPVVKDDFSSPALSEKWVAAKGKWTAENGKLRGSELAADKHAAVLAYPLPHTDSKVSFSFQLDGSDGFNLSFNHAKGHLFRVAVSTGSIQITLDKDKKDPASKVVLLKKEAVSLEKGKTYVMTCETAGEKVKVSLADGPVLEASHSAINTAKTGYRLVIKGDGVIFDDFTVHGASQS